MTVFNGTGADEKITPGKVSPSVNPNDTAPDELTDDVLRGKGGDDFLDGGGGDDTTNGGSGNDTYYKGYGGGLTRIYREDGHVILENAYPSRSELVNVERLKVVTAGNDDEIDIGYLGGTDLEDLIINLGTDVPDVFVDDVTADGSSGSDNVRIGSSGSTVSIKGLGVDMKLVDVDALDDLTVNAKGGDDRIDGSGMSDSSMSLSLHGGKGDDRVIGGDGVDNLWGDQGKDFIAGGNGTDYIHADGPGKDDTDTLKGGGGVDYFSLRVAESGVAADRILDFKPGIDKITGFGDLDDDAFYIGSKAADAEDRAIYNAETGKLFFDADGTGIKDKVLIAKLDKHLDLTSDDFIIVL